MFESNDKYQLEISICQRPIGMVLRSPLLKYSINLDHALESEDRPEPAVVYVAYVNNNVPIFRVTK